ncbi:hypothetical protein ACFYZ4_08345 [Streptomyces sp. NPDC001513]|uniref:hypothetical protein n=1 Tax=Streptomyces sp. NPDC001513 TaxID=3364580 RepID=UPI0036AB2E77
MNRYRSPEAWVEAAWQELDAPDTGRRDGCLEVVGDMLETGRLSQDDAERAVERLGCTDDRAVLPVVGRFLRHHHPGVRGEAADAVKELGRLRESPGEGAV